MPVCRVSSNKPKEIQQNKTSIYKIIFVIVPPPRQQFFLNAGIVAGGVSGAGNCHIGKETFWVTFISVFLHQITTMSNKISFKIKKKNKIKPQQIVSFVMNLLVS